MIKLHLAEAGVTSTFKFKNKDELLRTINNVLRDASLKNTLVFSVEEVKANAST